MILFGIMRSLAYLFKVYLGGVVSQAFVRLQRERVLRFSLENAEQLNSHEMINVYMERVVQAGQLVNLGAQLALSCTSALLFLALGLRLAPYEMICGIALLGLILLPMRLLNHRIQVAGEGIALESEISNRSLLQGLRHYFFLRIYGLIPAEVEKGVASICNYEQHYRNYFFALSLKHTFPVAAGVIIISVITYVSVQHLHTPAVKLISFFYIFIRLAQTASEGNTTLAEFRLQLPGFRRLSEWYLRIRDFSSANPELPKASISAENFRQRVQAEGLRLQIQGVTFGYETGRPILSDFSLEVGRGDVVVLQGESGAGKSTLLSLILGLRAPWSGQVLVNGLPVSGLRHLLGEYIGYVGPEPYLIPGTVRDNLLYGHWAADVPEGELWAALEKAQLARDIRALPHALSELLHEHTQLSTGQRQRLAIARAMLRRPRLLILDEASANLDGATEQNFIDGVKGALSGLTAVIISHKSSFNQIATSRVELRKR